MIEKEPTFKTLSMSKFASENTISENFLDANGQPMNIGAFLKTAKEGSIEKVASVYQNVQDPYPSPFLNLSDTKIPSRMGELFKWCKYYYTFDPLISGAINSLATFPVTDVFLEESPDEKNKKKKEESPQLKLYKKVILRNINIHKLLIEIGVDYWLYGNCFVFGQFWENPDTKEKEWKHVIRLDPSKIIIDKNEATQETKYKWQVPNNIRNIVKTRKPKEEYDKIPDIVKQAAEKGESLILNNNNIYHFSRPTDSMGDTMWGVPVVANVLKLLMYRNVLRQAQEAIAREHIVPFRIYYFEKTESYDTSTNWANVTKSFGEELSKSTRDPNYKVISPVPVNVINLGGQGKALMLTAEIEQVQSEILAGMNIPREFLFGGVSWSGSSISLKILENQFITYRLLLKDFLHFLVKSMAKVRKEWVSEKDDDSLVTVSLADLKMQDDVQQKQLIINLNSAGKVDDDTMWKSVGLDPEAIRLAIEEEAKLKVDFDKKVQIMRIEADVEVQKATIQAQLEIQRFQKKLQQELIQNEDPNDTEIGTEMAQQGQVAQPPQQGVDAQQNADTQVPKSEKAQQGQQQGDGVSLQSQPQQQSGNANTAAQNIQPEKQVNPNDINSVIQELLNTPREKRPEMIQKLPVEIQKVVLTQVDAIVNSKEQGDAGRGYQDAQKIAIEVMKLPKQQQEFLLAKLPGPIKNKVMSVITQLEQQEGPDKSTNGSNKIDMRAMPEVRPPRRNSMK